MPENPSDSTTSGASPRAAVGSVGQPAATPPPPADSATPLPVDAPRPQPVDLPPPIRQTNPAGDPAFPRGGGQFPSFGRRATDRVSRDGHNRPTDRMLNLLLMAAERDVRVGITVTVEGVVVSGTLIGTLAYCRALADEFISSSGGTDMDELFAESFEDMVDNAVGIASGDRRNPPDAASYEQAIRFIHLADARFAVPSGMLPLGRHGVLWRCPVSDVSGWSLGDLAAGT